MRMTDLSRVVFPVELRDVFVDVTPANSAERELRRYVGHKAVVDRRSGRPISVVSNDYRIITHEQAIAYGKQCAETLFEKVDPKGLTIFNVIAPTTGSHCYIDLLHREYEVKLWGRDVYIPFMRIANSYDRTRSLRFLIGFCRAICTNGVIFASEAIEFKFAHTQEQSNDIRFDIKKNQMKDLEAKFVGYMDGVKGLAVPKAHAFPTFCRGMELTFDIGSDNKKRRSHETDRLKAFRKRVSPIIVNYFDEMGDNAYALFNAMTDFASNTPEDDKQEALYVHSRQRKAGAWLQEITDLAVKPDFRWETYLKDYLPYGTVGTN
jgi:hypothetical protein